MTKEESLLIDVPDWMWLWQHELLAHSADLRQSSARLQSKIHTHLRDKGIDIDNEPGRS